MELNTAAQVALYVVLAFSLIFALIAVGLIFGIGFALSKLNQLIEQGLIKVNPIIDKTAEVLDTVHDVTKNVGTHADTILTNSAQISENIAKQVDSASSVVSKTVTSPLVTAASVMAGATKGFGAFKKKVKPEASDTTASNSKSDRNGSG
jgi:predicted PurR-regulated permease PerM